ncbi:MAG: DUF3990 domain-containing protein [Ruminococcus sp.]|jgi:hypothetical protein|nr:DUF3990 domain-containing protein [Ruminococcus sp.]
MILYHGSYTEIECPDISFSRDKLDFGKGFYVTPIFEQAKNWASRFLKRNKNAIVNSYDFFDELNLCKVWLFDKYTEEWLDFITNCRRGESPDEIYDIIIGGVANDKVFDTIEEYAQGYKTKEEAIKKLRMELPNLQYCFRKQNIINDFLHFAGSEEIHN